MSRPRLFASLVLALALVHVGCGSDESTPAQTAPGAGDHRPAPPKLSAADRALVRRSESAIVAYCERAAIAVTAGGRPPSERQRRSALGAVDALVGLAGEKPDATVRAGVDLRLLVGDLTEDLQGANCDPAIVARLDAGLASIP